MTENHFIRLKKKSDDEIHGPMDMAELLELGRSAFIAPEDEVSVNNGDWVLAPTIGELNMEWVVRTDDGIEYGPTSPGTIREFLMVGEVSEDTLVFHKSSKEEKSVKDLLGNTAVSQVREEQQEAEQQENKVDNALDSVMDMAKDLKIRQLQTDLEQMESKYNSLMMKYRQATEELTKLKQS
ncbi:MAG: hypothetical protein AAF558_12385 [Verrucomicrobiota bacterium]